MHDQHQGPCAPIEKGITTFQCSSPAFQPGSVNPVGLEFVGGVTGELQTAPPGWDIALDLEAIGPVLEEPSAARQSQGGPQGLLQSGHFSSAEPG